MEQSDWLTLAAIVIGPVVAVGITLIVQHYRERRERRLIFAPPTRWSGRQIKVREARAGTHLLSPFFHLSSV